MLKEFYEKHRNALFVLGVAIVTYFLYFHNLGNLNYLMLMKQDMSICHAICGKQAII